MNVEVFLLSMFNKKFFKSFFQKRATLSSTILILGLVLGIGVSFVLAQGWQEPTATPPGDNAPAPINVSATEQRKVGPLRINNYLIAGRDSNDNIIPNIGVIGYGNVLGGMFNTSDKYGYIGYGDYGGFFIGDGYFSGQLIIDTKVISPEYCIDGDCITSWPSGGGGAVNCSDCNDTFVNENQNNSITTDMLEDNSVTNIKIDGDSVNTANITNNTILWEDFDTILQNNLLGGGAALQDLFSVLSVGSNAETFTECTKIGGDPSGTGLIVGNIKDYPAVGQWSKAETGIYTYGSTYGIHAWGGNTAVYGEGVTYGGTFSSPGPTAYLSVAPGELGSGLGSGGYAGYFEGDTVIGGYLSAPGPGTLKIAEGLTIEPYGGGEASGEPFVAVHGPVTIYGGSNLTLSDYGWDGTACTGGRITACEIVTTNPKSFVQPHPTDPTKEINYVSIEGPDARVYFDGVAKLTHGKAVIKVPEDFRLVASEITPLNVILTPFGPASLYAASRSLEEIAVQEKDGNSDAEFGYMVITDRAGYENRKAIRENTHFKK